MVKAKFSASGIFSLAVSFVLLAGCCLLAFGCFAAAFGSGHIFGRIVISEGGAIVGGIIFTSLAAVLVYVFRRFVFFINIDTKIKTITFRNILATQSQTYGFSEFTGFSTPFA